MTPTERKNRIQLKVERAKKHIFDLEGAIRAFLDGKPYKVGAKRDPDTRKLIYYLTSVETTPDNLPLIAGDAIQCLRTSLDHLAYEIICSDVAPNPPPNPKGIYFPIDEDFTKYEAGKSRKMQGAHPDSIAAIDALKPYKGGNDQLWILHRLNNVEKHRKLITVGSIAAGVNVGQHMAGMLRKQEMPGAPDGLMANMIASMMKMNVFIMPADRGFPLKAGDNVFIDAVDAELNPDLQFRFDVALDEPGIIESQSILESVHQLSTLVEGVVSALAVRFR